MRVLKLQLKNLDKNLIGNIVIIISIILVFLCIGLVWMSNVTEVFESVDSQVEWNGAKYMVPGDAEATVSDDSLIIESPYETHNVQLKKTKDLSNYKKNIEGDYGSGYSDFNSTHIMISNDKLKYAAIVPKDTVDFESVDNLYQIKGNPEIIEVTGGDSMYMISFVSSATTM